MKRQALYVYTCRKPSGWGRHFGYSGVTNAPHLRDGQHRAGKPWSDLIVRRRVIPLGRVPRFVAEALEWLLIKATMPVYNVQHNHGNPRRIKPATARRQRGARDMMRRTARSPFSVRRTALALQLCAISALALGSLYLWSNH